jgi:membrane protein DedA with SNARE-associated domain
MGRNRLRDSDADGILPVAIGTVAWVVALIVLVVNWPRLEQSDNRWWVGVAVVGVVSGALGLVFLYWRRGRQHNRDTAGPIGQE